VGVLAGVACRIILLAGFLMFLGSGWGAVASVGIGQGGSGWSKLR